MPGRNNHGRGRNSTAFTITTTLLAVSIGALIIRRLGEAPKRYERPPRRPSRRERARLQVNSWFEEQEEEIEASRFSIYAQPRRALTSPLLVPPGQLGPTTST